MQGGGDRVPEGVLLHQKTDQAWQDGLPSAVSGWSTKGGMRQSSSGTGSAGSHGDSSGWSSTMSNEGRHHGFGGLLNDGASKFGGSGAHVDGGVLSGGANGGEWLMNGGGALSSGRNGSMAGSSTEDASSTTPGHSAAGGQGGGGWSGWGQGTDSGKESEGEGSGGRTKPPAASSDAGKNVRVQGAGFIARASSPTGSEWGDPTHARMFISNTACSSRAGSSLGGRVQDDELGTTQSAPGLLQARPKLTAADFVWGPPLTRAFTFSYHRHVAPASKPAAANRGRIKPTRRK